MIDNAWDQHHLMEAAAAVLRAAGRDPDSDPAIVDTPERYVRAWQELTEGSTVDPAAIEPFTEPSWILDLDLFRSAPSVFDPEEIADALEVVGRRAALPTQVLVELRAVDRQLAANFGDRAVVAAGQFKVGSEMIAHDSGLR